MFAASSCGKREGSDGIRKNLELRSNCKWVPPILRLERTVFSSDAPRHGHQLSDWIDTENGGATRAANEEDFLMLRVRRSGATGGAHEHSSSQDVVLGLVEPSVVRQATVKSPEKALQECRAVMPQNPCLLCVAHEEWLSCQAFPAFLASETWRVVPDPDRPKGIELSSPPGRRRTEQSPPAARESVPGRDLVSPSPPREHGTIAQGGGCASSLTSHTSLLHRRNATCGSADSTCPS